MLFRSIVYTDDGIMESQCWYRDGRQHRDVDLPALIRYRNGIIESERWYRDDCLHREGDFPAEIRYHESGKIKSQQYCYRDGQLHKALIRCNGIIESVEWCIDDLPVFIHYREIWYHLVTAS